ncbi:MAG: hypothetical protein ACOCXZ_01680 [Chloroflexota bacterium]
MSYIAKPFVAGTPQALVAGQAVIAFADNLVSDAIAPLLPKHGLDNIDPEKWYPHQSWLDVLEDLGGRPDASSVFVAFGRKVVETAVMPPEIQTADDMLDALHAIHHANLQNVPEEEGYYVEKLGPKHYYVHHNTPNPEDAIYGFLWGLMSRFCTDDEQFVVRLLPNEASQHGRSVYEVKWGRDV